MTSLVGSKFDFYMHDRATPMSMLLMSKKKFQVRAVNNVEQVDYVKVIKPSPFPIVATLVHGCL